MHQKQPSLFVDNSRKKNVLRQDNDILKHHIKQSADRKTVLQHPHLLEVEEGLSGSQISWLLIPSNYAR